MTRNLEVDRSELADTSQPGILADLLIQQIAPQLEKPLPLPINEVAMACGIVEIQPIDTTAFEGGLIQNTTKSKGFVLIRAGRLPQRTRFTIAHELGHFVNLRHVAPQGEDRLVCTKDDLRSFGAGASYRHGMEAQANEFAAGLLMPRSLLTQQAFMKGSPEIGRVLALQSLCDVSKEAAARRYAELHGADFAIIFTLEGKIFQHPIRGGSFPWLDLGIGQPVYRDALTRNFQGVENDISDQEETRAEWWIDSAEASRWNMWEEVLILSKGFRLTLLVGERDENSYRRHQERWTPRFK